MIRFFLPQSVLEEWSSAELAALSGGNQLSLTAEKMTMSLIPAVHFSKLVLGADDRQLLSKVKPNDQLQALGAEQMGDSVIVGDTAYEVIPGFIAEPMAGAAAAAAQASGTSDADLLAAFIIDKLT